MEKHEIAPPDETATATEKAQTEKEESREKMVARLAELAM